MEGSFALPSQFLEGVAADLVVTRGFDNNLMLFELDRWRLFAEKVLSRPISLGQTRNLRRRLFSGAAKLTVAQDNRVRLPSTLRAFAGLQHEAIISGMYDYMEIWNAEQWEAEREKVDNSSDASLWETLGI
jgi:MraZ protein